MAPPRWSQRHRTGWRQRKAVSMRESSYRSRRLPIDCGHRLRPRQTGHIQPVFGPAEQQSEDLAVRTANALASKHAAAIAWSRDANAAQSEYGEPTTTPFVRGDVPDLGDGLRVRRGTAQPGAADHRLAVSLSVSALARNSSVVDGRWSFNHSAIATSSRRLSSQARTTSVSPSDSAAAMRIV